MSELEAQVGAAEAVDGDGQLDDLSPARTVTVVEDERVVGASVWLSRAQADAILGERSNEVSFPGGPSMTLPGGPSLSCGSHFPARRNL